MPNVKRVGELRSRQRDGFAFALVAGVALVSSFKSLLTFFGKAKEVTHSAASKSA